MIRGRSENTTKQFRRVAELLNVGEFYLAKAELLDARDETDDLVAWSSFFAECLLRLGESEALEEFLDGLPAEGDTRILYWQFKGRLWIRGGDYRRTVSELGSFLIRFQGGSSGRIAKVWDAVGEAWFRMGEIGQARLCYEKSLERYCEVLDSSGQAGALAALAHCEIDGLNWRKAERHLVGALKIQDLTSVAQRIVALQNLGVLRFTMGRFQEAQTAFHEALTLSQDTGDTRRVANALAGIAISEVRDGDIVAARQTLAKVLRQTRRGTNTADRHILLIVEEYMGEFHLSQGNLGKARAWLQRSISLAEIVSDRQVVGESKRLLAQLELVEGNMDAARELAEESLLDFVAMKEVYETAVSRRVVGQVLACLGDREGARSVLNNALENLAPAGERFETRRIHRILRAVDRGDSVRNIWEQDQPKPQRVLGSVAKHHPEFPEIIGADPILMAQLEQAKNYATTSIPVLIQGETGTGKELVARGIHRISQRTKGAFVAFNCGTRSSDLVESEFFGHVRGAFTGALQARTGLIREADGGTLFLDEIADLPRETQPRLLRVLDDGEIRPIGSNSIEHSNFRLITATHQPMDKAVAAGGFRQDLYYRLSSFQVVLPPLRSRIGDLELLVPHFVEYAREHVYQEFSGVSDAIMAAMSSYSWPGNLRELRSEIMKLASQEAAGQPSSWSADGITCQGLIDALTAASGNVSAVAKLLGTSRRTIHRRADAWGLDLGSFR